MQSNEPVHCAHRAHRIRILNNKQKSASVSSEVTKYLFLAGHATEWLLRQRDDEHLYFQPRPHRLQIATWPKREETIELES